jgi:hypothetical protein
MNQWVRPSIRALVSSMMRRWECIPLSKGFCTEI